VNLAEANTTQVSRGVRRGGGGVGGGSGGDKRKRQPKDHASTAQSSAESGSEEEPCDVRNADPAGFLVPGVVSLASTHSWRAQIDQGLSPGSDGRKAAREQKQALRSENV